MDKSPSCKTYLIECTTFTDSIIKHFTQKK